MISSFVFRAVRVALKNDPRTQEQVVGSLLIPLAIADVSLRVAIFAQLSFEPLLPDHPVCISTCPEMCPAEKADLTSVSSLASLDFLPTSGSMLPSGMEPLTETSQLPHFCSS